MCDHTYCYTPAVMKIREVVQSGMLGDLQFFLEAASASLEYRGAVVPLRIAR